MTDPDADTRRLFEQALAAGEVTGWFEPLYAEAARGAAVVPWDRQSPNAHLVAWANDIGLVGNGRSALVVGCGYGRDAEYLAELGFAVTAFDVSATAIEQARQRHPDSPVDYVVADLLHLPEQWRSAFAFVLESHNVQALPEPTRTSAIAAVHHTVAPGGKLAVLAAAAAEDGEPADEPGPPWPLRRTEVDAFAGGALDPVEIVRTVADDGIPRWRAVFAAPG
jgi:SAM-dependent methyltransferase